MLIKNEISNWFEFDIWVNVSLPEDVDQSLSINDFLHNFRFRDSRWGTFEKEDRIRYEIMTEENEKSSLLQLLFVVH